MNATPKAATPPLAATTTIDLSRTVYQLTDEHPELVEILASLGFLGVRSPVLRATLGRTMTVPEGCRRQGKDLAEVLAALASRGFRAAPEA